MSKTLDEASGTIDFHAYPNLGISFKGKIGQASLNIDGDWNNGQFALISIKGKDINLPEFRDAIPPIQGISLEGGKATTLTMTTERDLKGFVKWQTEGEFSGLKITGKRNITDGQGRFSGNQDGIKLEKMSFTISDQRASGEGTLTWPKGVVSIDAVLSVPDLDPGAFMSGLAVQRPITCQVKVAGPLAEPDISGNFNIPQATFSSMPIAVIAGMAGIRRRDAFLEYGPRHARRAALRRLMFGPVAEELYRRQIESIFFKSLKCEYPLV